jgi:hypothetical protein
MERSGQQQKNEQGQELLASGMHSIKQHQMSASRSRQVNSGIDSHWTWSSSEL